MIKKNYKTSPLPFQGQKRNFIEPFRTALLEIDKKEKIKIVVDLFGGSGLLSHTAKRLLPDCQVIYNDYDDFHVRLQNIGRTNILIRNIRDIVKSKKNGEKIDNETKNKILDCIYHDKLTGVVDYITISSSLLFSANYVLNFDELQKATLYNNVKQNDYPECVEDYLKGLDIVRQDYILLFERYKNIPGVVFVTDPPYLSTDTSTYNSDKYWRLADYLNVLRVLKATNYIFFTSNKSSLIEFCDWFMKHYNVDNPFYGAKLCTHNVSINKQARYTDMMLYKHRT